MRKLPNTPERILAGAHRAFARLGYDAARVEDILEASGVSRRTFYQHFPSKDAVAEVLWERAARTLLAKVRLRMERAASPREAIAGALEAYVAGWGRSAGYLRDLSLDSLRPGSPLASKRKQGVRAMVQRLVAEAEKVRGVRPPSEVVEHCVLGLHGLLLHRTEARGLTQRSAGAIRDATLAVAERVLLGESHLTASEGG